VLLAAIFVIQERWAAHPVLDLRLFRLARFTVPNIVACCTCLATFAIFFFAALYLAEVPQDSGYRIALVFAPMAVLMIAASVIAGFWAGRAGPRWPVTVGCAAFAAGLLLASPQISPQPDYLVLSLALALAGTGIGTTVGPVTTAVLSAVPPERSGMAASAVNTSREVGAVAGVSVLGALVFSRLNATLSSHLAALNVPAGDKAAIMAFRPVIIQYIETGQAGAGGYARYGSIVGRVIGAAYAAFGDGLHAALYVSATIVIAAGITAAAALK
jgi:predicted MFS family arabinose efflux permease